MLKDCRVFHTLKIVVCGNTRTEYRPILRSGSSGSDWLRLFNVGSGTEVQPAVGSCRSNGVNPGDDRFKRRGFTVGCVVVVVSNMNVAGDSSSRRGFGGRGGGLCCDDGVESAGLKQMSSISVGSNSGVVTRGDGVVQSSRSS